MLAGFFVRIGQERGELEDDEYVMCFWMASVNCFSFYHMLLCVAAHIQAPASSPHLPVPTQLQVRGFLLPVVGDTARLCSSAPKIRHGIVLNVLTLSLMPWGLLSVCHLTISGPSLWTSLPSTLLFPAVLLSAKLVLLGIRSVIVIYEHFPKAFLVTTSLGGKSITCFHRPSSLWKVINFSKSLPKYILLRFK